MPKKGGLTKGKRLTQEEFDAAVKDMIKSLGLEGYEAVESVVEEYEMQGYSLDGIIKAVGGSDALESTPSALCAKNLKENLDDKKAHEYLELLSSAIDDLKITLEDGEGAEQQQSLLAAANFDSVQSLFRVCDICMEQDPPDERILFKALSTLQLQMDCELARDRFNECKGAKRLAPLLASYRDNTFILESLLATVSLAGKEHEENKCNFMFHNLDEFIASLLLDAHTDHDTIEGACLALRTLLTADDHRPTPHALEATFGGEFNKALTMDSHGVTAALVGAFRRHINAEPVVRCLCATLRKVALNDDICRKCVDDAECKCIGDLLSILRGDLRDEGKSKSKQEDHAILLLLKQLSACDQVKRELVHLGFVPLAVTLLRRYRLDKAVTLANLFVMTNVTLRNREVAEAFADEGGFAQVFVVSDRYCGESAKLMKQVCMLVRNAAVRSDKVRRVLREEGDMESVLRAARDKHRKECLDAATAALRDMGVQDYRAR